jgi:hypothetical protein
MDVDDVEPAAGQPLPQKPRGQGVHGQLERQPKRQAVNLDAVHPVDETAAFTTTARGGREHDNLVPTTDEAGRKVMDLHLDSAQAGEITVRQHGDLHRTQRCMRQDGT